MDNAGEGSSEDAIRLEIQTSLDRVYEVATEDEEEADSGFSIGSAGELLPLDAADDYGDNPLLPHLQLKFLARDADLELDLDLGKRGGACHSFSNYSSDCEIGWSSVGFGGNDNPMFDSGMELMLLDDESRQFPGWSDDIETNGTETAESHRVFNVILALIGPVQVLVISLVWWWYSLQDSDGGLLYRRIEGVDYALDARFEGQVTVCLGIALAYAVLVVAFRDLAATVTQLVRCYRQ